MLSSSLNKYNRRSFVINNSSISIPELMNNARYENQGRDSGNTNAAGKTKHASENDLFDKDDDDDGESSRTRFDHVRRSTAVDYSHLTNFDNLMLIASNQQYRDDEYDEEHFGNGSVANARHHSLSDNYYIYADPEDNTEVANTTASSSVYAKRTRLSENVVTEDESINFCNDIDFNTVTDYSTHAEPRMLKLSENYSSNINLAKINESDDYQETTATASFVCAGKSMIARPIQQKHQSADSSKFIYHHADEKCMSKNLKSSKNSFKLIQSARSSTSSILSIDRFKRMKSKRRSSSSQTSERANNRKIITAKNLLEQIQSLHTHGSRNGRFALNFFYFLD
jgi:hypothetical protein